MDIAQAAFDYAIRIAEVVKYLRSDDKGFPLCDELLKSGVSAGMYLREPPDRGKAACCFDRADYILEMATAAGYLTALQTQKIRESGRGLNNTILKNLKTKGGTKE